MRRNALVLFACAGVLAGCQSPEEEQQEQKEVERKSESEAASEDDVQSAASQVENIILPSEPEEFVVQGDGEFGEEQVGRGDDSKEAFLASLADISLPEDASEEELDQLFSYIYGLTKVALPDPSNVLDEARFDLEGMPEMDPRYAFKENYTIEIILDASGSMAVESENGETRMDQAKSEIRQFLSSVPEETSVSLRVYGHEGTGSEDDKEKSCAAIEEVYERGSYNEEAFDEALDRFEPAGWTPIAAALTSAAESFDGLSGDENTNLIYLVSDGIETCDGDPVEAARQFAGTDIAPVIHVIGFDADNEAQQQLKQVAMEADGDFVNVKNAEGLRDEFARADVALRKWEQWRTGALNERNWTNANAAMDINRFSIDWNNKAREQVNSQYNAFDALLEEGIITYDQLGPLKDRATALYDASREAGTYYYDELNEVKDAGIEGMEQVMEDSRPEN